MSIDVAAIVERARTAAQQAGPDAGGAAPGREELQRIAAEFESMLLVQVLKDMRRAGSWEEEGGDALGAQSLFETLDVELASHLARVRGLGLGKQMEEAFDRMNLAAAPAGTRAAEDSAGAGRGGVEKVLTSVAAGKPGPDVVSAVKIAAEKTVAAVEKTGPAIGHILKPVAGAVTSAFGWRRHPITHEVKFHQGVDLRAAYGQEVQSAAGGKVVFSGDQGGYGATVVVEHQDGTRTRYAHLSARLVKQGDVVTAGEPLGRAGKSGSATGTHLHFEVIAPNGQRIAPERWAGGRHSPLAGAAPGQAGPAEVERHAHGPAGKPSLVAVNRSIQDRSARAD